jgi:hypothetical protein
VSWVLRCFGIAGVVDTGVPFDPTDMYLSGYDPEFHGGDGRAEWTTERSQALTFPTMLDAVSFARQIPGAKPLRPDGKPNRPLTAFHLVTQQVDDDPL